MTDLLVYLVVYGFPVVVACVGVALFLKVVRKPKNDDSDTREDKPENKEPKINRFSLYQRRETYVDEKRPDQHKSKGYEGKVRRLTFDENLPNNGSISANKSLSDYPKSTVFFERKQNVNCGLVGGERP